MLRWKSICLLRWKSICVLRCKIICVLRCKSICVLRGSIWWEEGKHFTTIATFEDRLHSLRSQSSCFDLSVKVKANISQMIDTDRVGWSFLFPAISPFLHQTQQNDLISPTTLNIFYASFISFLRRFMNMRLWHFPRPNQFFAHLLKYFTSKLKNEEFISINRMGLCSINWKCLWEMTWWQWVGWREGF